MTQYLIEWTRDDYSEAFVAELTPEQALDIHDKVNARPGEDLVANYVEVLSYKEAKTMVGLR